MNSHKLPRPLCTFIVKIFLGLCLVSQTLPAQLPLSTTTAQTQIFDGIGTSATATLPANFKADRLSSVRTVDGYAAAGSTTTQVGGANLSTSATNGIYNFGSGTTSTGGSDRAIGFLSSGTATQSGNLYAQFVNNTGGDLSGLQISYDVEKYRNGSNSAGFRIQLFYSFDGTNWTNAGSDFLTSFSADANNNGFSPAPGATVSVSNKTLTVNIPNISTIYLAWNYSVASGTTTTNAQALAIDNISVLGVAGPPPTSPSGTGAANPSTVVAGSATLVTVSVIPGSNPTSTSITVTGDLTAIGGSATQSFFDDGTHGDATGGDNVFSFQATVASGTVAGSKSLPITIADAQSRTGNTSISLAVQNPTPSVPTATPFTENLNGIGTSATAVMPPDFKVDKQSTVRTLGTFASAGITTERVGGAGLTSSSANGIYNFGDGTTTGGGTDRAVGFLSSGSGTQSGNLYARLKNNSGGNLFGLRISYDVEKYRNGSNPAGFRIQMFYSFDGSTWTDAGTDFLTSFAADANSEGFTTVPGSTVSVTDKILAATIPSGSNVYLAWNYSVTTGTSTTSAQALAVDNVSVLGLTTNLATNPSGTGTATPSTVTVGNSTLLTVTVTPGEFPTSTGITVAGNLSSIGGSASQTFFDDGTNGDVTAGDNIFSYQATVATNTSPGSKTLPITISDAQGRTGSTSIVLSVQAPITAIHDIQGSGTSSPLVGQTVSTRAIVTGSKSNGFFIQTPDAEIDNNSSTSEGIFVFTSSTPPSTAAIGNSVTVTGTVSEFIPSSDQSSPPVTEISGSPTATLNSTGNLLPAPILLTAADTSPTGSIEQLERFEGMRVQVNSLTVIAPTQGFTNEANATGSTNGVFYGVITAVARPFREPGIEIPNPLPSGAPTNVPRFDANSERLRVDSDAQPGTVPLEVTSGATVMNLVGPLDYSTRTYTILPDAATPPSVSGNISAIQISAPAANQFTVASFNMERFFDTVDDPGISDVALTQTAFNNRLNKASLTVRNVMRSPDIIGVEEMENLTTLQAVANKVNADAIAAGQPNPNYQAYLIEGNDVGGIDVGFLVKASRVSVVDVTQEGKDATFINPNTGQADILNDRPPLILRATIQPPTGPPFPVTVIVNHLRSLSGIDDLTDGNRIRTKRRAQAEFLANLIQARQAADPNERIISLGDYNSFQFNDGYVDVIGTIKGTPTPADQVVLASNDLVNPDLIDLVDSAPADQRYSFMFDGNAQELDHVLISQNLLGRANGLQYARNDADFPETYRSDPNRSERISDHDPIVAYFAIPSETQTSVASSPNPSVLNQTVTFTATVTSGGSAITEGTVTFKEGTTVLAGPVSLDNNGQASFSTSGLSIESHTITAQYSSSNNFNSSSGSIGQTVNSRPTTTSVSSSLNPSTYGQSVTFTATVKDGNTQATVSEGSVTFKEGATVLAGPTNLDGNGQAGFTTSTLTAAGSPHTITAEYSGSTNFNASSGSLSQTVNKATATLTPSNLTFTYDGTPKSATVTTNPAGLTIVSITYGGSTTPPTNAGGYAVVATLTNDNYQAQNATGTLVINKASLTATADDKSRAYGEQNPVLTGTLIGVVNGDAITASYSTTATPASSVGTYDIVSSLNDPNNKLSNYTMTLTKGTLTITAAATRTSVAAASVQYSDPVTLTAVVTGANAQTQSEVNTGGTVSFSSNGTVLQPQSPGITYSANGTLTATGTFLIMLAPGSYNVVATFTPTSSNVTGSASGDGTSGPLTVNAEDARAPYSGSEVFSTGSQTSSTATITLSATIKDITAVPGDAALDASAGDITKATVTFVDRDNNSILASDVPVGLVSSSDAKVGTATKNIAVTLSNSEMSAGAKIMTIGIIVNGFYTRNSGEDNTVITIQVPGNQFISGGGYLNLSNSAGLYPGAVGSKNNFGFTVKYNKSGTHLQGNMNTIVRNNGRVYQIKGNAMTSLAVQNNTATFNGKANIQDVTDPSNVLSIDGNASLQVEMTDNGTPGTKDSIGITVWNKQGGLWFSSNWNGTKTVQQNLEGGNLSMLGGVASARFVDGAGDEQGSLSEVSAIPTEYALSQNYPNPFNPSTTIRYALPRASHVVLKVFNMLGEEVATLVGEEKDAGFYQVNWTPQLPSGVYFYRLQAGDFAATKKLLLLK